MKISRFFMHSGLLSITLGIFIYVFTSFEINSHSLMDSFKEPKKVKLEFKDEIDLKTNAAISKIAYGITDNIDNAAIKKTAYGIERFVVYDGLTLDELSDKLNRSLKGVLANKGKMIAEKCLDLKMDPYMAVAIMLHETGCNSSCSSLARNYYNVGGMKAGSGNFQKFSSIDEGIDTFLNNLYGNYYVYGLDTPEKINPKYAASTSWASKINSYMKMIKEK